MLRDLAFFWRPKNTASRGRGWEKNQSAMKFRKNAPQVCTFLNSFVQDCNYNTNNLATLNLKMILMKHWDIIQQQPKLKHIFNQPSIVSYRKDMSQGHSS